MDEWVTLIEMNSFHANITSAFYKKVFFPFFLFKRFWNDEITAVQIYIFIYVHWCYELIKLKKQRKTEEHSAKVTAFSHKIYVLGR